VKGENEWGKGWGMGGEQREEEGCGRRRRSGEGREVDE
jgi:hypothetical protein